MNINANGCTLSPHLVRAALRALPAMPAAAHTRQELIDSWMGQGITVQIEEAEMINFPATQLSIADIPLRIDLELSPGVLEFRDSEDRVVARIENIGLLSFASDVPSGSTPL